MALVRTMRDQFDWPLFVCCTAIAVLGVINLYSATDGSTQYADLYIKQMPQ